MPARAKTAPDVFAEEGMVCPDGHSCSNVDELPKESLSMINIFPCGNDVIHVIRRTVLGDG